jgi:tight adherence protein B
MTLLTPLLLKEARKKLLYRRNNMLNTQFREFLYCISGSLRAGKSLEGALCDSINDLTVMFNKNDLIIKEVELIIKKIKMNIPVEDALSDFAMRTKSEDIINFSEIINICNRTGGDTIQIIKSSAEIIGEKISIKNDIEVLISKKALESKLLLIVPIILIIMLSTTSYDFVQPLYTTYLGRITMTVSIITLYISYALTEKIIAIRI